MPPVGPEAGGGVPRLPAPRSAPGPARGARPPSVPAVLPPSSVRVPLGRRASRLTGGRGRQSAGGRVPARGCAGESAGPAARGGRRGYRARRRRSSSPACSSRALCEPPEGRCSAAAAGAEGGGAGCGQGRGAGTRRAELAAPSLPSHPSAGRGERGPGGGAGARGAVPPARAHSSGGAEPVGRGRNKRSEARLGRGGTWCWVQVKPGRPDSRAGVCGAGSRGRPCGVWRAVARGPGSAPWAGPRAPAPPSLPAARFNPGARPQSRFALRKGPGADLGACDTLLRFHFFLFFLFFFSILFPVVFVKRNSRGSQIAVCTHKHARG